MKTLFNKFTLTLALLGLSFVPAAKAQETTVASLVYLTANTVVTGGDKIITGFTFTSAAATNSTLLFYDTTSNATNIVRPAHTLYSTYTTNYSTTFTNFGVVYTNTYSGIYRAATAVSAATNEAPNVLGPYFVPASGTVTVEDLAFIPVRGLTVKSTFASGTLQLNYRSMR